MNEVPNQPSIMPATEEQPGATPRNDVARDVRRFVPSLAALPKIRGYEIEDVIGIDASDALEISAKTGLVGYPTYSSWAEGGGIALKTIFNPLLIVGSRCKVESGLPVANGNWIVFFVSHDIESLVRGGQWFTMFHGAGLGNG